MPNPIIIEILPKDTINLLLEFLDEDVLTSDSSILNLRSVNKDLYNLVNHYWASKYCIKQIICGNHNTYILLENGDLYGCGSNGKIFSTIKDQAGQIISQEVGYSRLGLVNTILKSNKFVKVSKNVKKAFIDEEKLLIVTNNNKLYGKGNTHSLGLNHLQQDLPYTYSYSDKSSQYNFTQNFQEIAININIKDIAISEHSII
ncbi:MAG: RCC1-like domain-containing protein, partial [Gammaproteobacteria bacterium]